MKGFIWRLAIPRYDIIGQMYDEMHFIKSGAPLKMTPLLWGMWQRPPACCRLMIIWSSNQSMPQYDILHHLHTQYWLRSECLLRRYTFQTHMCTTWKVQFIQRRGASVGNPWNMHKLTLICKLFDIIQVIYTKNNNNETNLHRVKLKNQESL